ncbi:hypothetical protein MNBD_GAMMA17-419 [hydrothermal vent metagenome]|uniref:HMA domain-containing protein n=1 Tax=hydrothermal vent metagenome TaxID=652676 RepID=A0A3B0Z6L2_9ZZZZ
MKRAILISLLILILPSLTTAAEQTLNLQVENMNCALCPLMVKKAMGGVEGVTSVDVDYEKHQAVVIFDDAVADPEQIALASTNAGYPEFWGHNT